MLPMFRLEFLHLHLESKIVLDTEAMPCCYRAMKNPERLAASKKSPLVAQYCYGKIEYVRSEAAQ